VRYREVMPVSSKAAPTVDPSSTLGRRERKKAATRVAISEAATRLFLARGYDAVSLKEIADEADVAVATLFAHFPGKEALIFDEDQQLEEGLLGAVRDRPAGVTVLDALEAHFAASRAIADADNPLFREFQDLINDTPALAQHWRNTWLQYEVGLARVIAETDEGVTAEQARVLARLAIESSTLAAASENPPLVLETAFGILRSGWPPTR
jgi:AcrR family transcriptional regulator